VCGAGTVIGAGVAIISTAFASPSAIVSIRWIPIVKGVTSTDSGDGGGVYPPVTVVADAAGGVDIPMATAAINAITAQPTDRITRST